MQADQQLPAHLANKWYYLAADEHPLISHLHIKYWLLWFLFQLVGRGHRALLARLIVLFSYAFVVLMLIELWLVARHNNCNINSCKLWGVMNFSFLLVLRQFFLFVSVINIFFVWEQIGNVNYVFSKYFVCTVSTGCNVVSWFHGFEILYPHEIISLD